MAFLTMEVLRDWVTSPLAKEAEHAALCGAAQTSAVVDA